MAFQDELPPCKDFTRIPINRALWRIVAKVSGRFFAGAELARSEEYMDMSINYTLEIAGAVKGIAAIKPEEREAKAPSLPQLVQLQNRRKRTLEFIRPLIAARKKAMAEDIDYQAPDDMIQWILNGEKKYGKLSVEELAEIQLFLIFAAIHTTTMTTINAFYTLAAMPEIVPELRDEIRAVLMEHDGKFSTPALQKMEKLDSFLREVMRVYPLSLSTFQRKVHRPITLSNGQLIPAGVIIEIPAHSIVHDPERFDRPGEFDAFRHYRARHSDAGAGASPGGEKKAPAGAGAAAHQMVSTSLNNLPFGYGRQACPGRFFAANEIKMIVARAVLDYEIQLADGATERYPNIEYNEAVSLLSPCPGGLLSFCRTRLRVFMSFSNSRLNIALFTEYSRPVQGTNVQAGPYLALDALTCHLFSVYDYFGNARDEDNGTGMGSMPKHRNGNSGPKRKPLPIKQHACTCRVLGYSILTHQKLLYFIEATHFILG